jgi:hypothetical protein
MTSHLSSATHPNDGIWSPDPISEGLWIPSWAQGLGQDQRAESEMPVTTWQGWGQAWLKERLAFNNANELLETPEGNGMRPFPNSSWTFVSHFEQDTYAS